MLLGTLALAPKKLPEILKQDVGAGGRGQSLLVTNFDHAFVSGSKVKYVPTNPLFQN